MPKSCPICSAQWYRVSASEKVCQQHQEWFITICEVCGRRCFSDCIGICLTCHKTRAEYPPPGVARKTDHRAYLRFIGQEDTW